MKDTKFYIVSGFTILIGVLVILFTWLKFVDLSFSDKISKEVMIASIGLMGALIGGVFSGLLTLAGVRLTIKQQYEIMEIEKKKYIQDKSNLSQFIFKQVFHRIITLQTHMKNLSTFHTEERLQSVYKYAEELEVEAEKLFAQASSISVEFLDELRAVSFSAKAIKEYIDEMAETDCTVEQIAKKMLSDGHYNRLAIADLNFYESAVKHRMMN